MRVAIACSDALSRRANPTRMNFSHSTPVYSQGVEMNKKEVARSGISFGTALAIAISWSQHGSILWAIIHGIFSWLYVIYFALTRPV